MIMSFKKSDDLWFPQSWNPVKSIFFNRWKIFQLKFNFGNFQIAKLNKYISKKPNRIKTKNATQSGNNIILKYFFTLLLLISTIVHKGTRCKSIFFTNDFSRGVQCFSQIFEYQMNHEGIFATPSILISTIVHSNIPM